VASWFRTSTDFASNAYIVNKGGSGSDTTGQNMNYGISMSTTENIIAEFETRTGVDHIITSPNRYNDGQWHYAVGTYDGTNLRLYIDGAQVATKTTGGAVPDNTGTQPVRIGANSRTLNQYFTGNADEVRVWNRALTAQEVSDQYNNGIFNTNGQVLYLPFGTSTPPPPPPPPGSIYHYEPYATLSGSNYTDVPSSSSLQLTTSMSVASWFRTTTNHADTSFIVNKGGHGSETPGQNINYGIFMTGSETITAMIETQSGVDHAATSTSAYNDGQWHYAVMTYDGTTLRLYIDGVQVASKSTGGAVPDNTGTQPVKQIQPPV
jgi:hypothetical protein